MSDLISRQAAIDICNSAIDLWHGQLGEGALVAVKEKIEGVPSAQPEPCEDAVSRETLLKFFDDWMSVLDENCHNQSVSDLKIIKRDFANLPPVMPKQRTGKWVLVGDNMTKREFLDIVFALAPTEANRIMDAFDEYVESTEPHWIPCSERLPERNGDYLCQEKLGFLYVDTWNGEYWDCADRAYRTVIAWMPLPEPYKGVTDGRD